MEGKVNTRFNCETETMNRKLLNELVRNAAGFALVAVMLVTAGLTGEREIIFPEVGALAVGLLIIDRTVWNTGKLRMILLLCLESAIGVWMMRHTGDLPVWIPVSAAFLFANFLILLFRSTLLPAVAACLMPLYLSVDKYAYAVISTSLAIFGTTDNRDSASFHVPCFVSVRNTSTFPFLSMEMTF